MSFNLHNHSLLSLVHHSTRDLKYLLDLSRDLKRAKYSGTEQQHLKGKNVSPQSFEKTSTRTHCAFEVKPPMTKAQMSPTLTQPLHKLVIKKP